MLTDTILRLPAVKAAVGLSKTTIYQRIKDQTFPEPVPIDGGRVGWPESVINAWVAAKKAGIPWQPPIDAAPQAPPQAAAPPAPSSPPVDRAEVVKNRARKARKADQGFQLTANPPAPPMKRAQKPTRRRPQSSRNESIHDATQSEFRFD